VDRRLGFGGLIVREFVRNLLTESDNTTYDAGRVLWAAGVIVFLGLAVYVTVKRDQPEFDFQAFGIGFGAVLAAGGGMVAWMREPPRNG
jgi:Zn-dependent protease